MITITNYEAANWAAQFVKIGATIDVVNRELICCNVAPESAARVRSQFTQQTLAASELAKRGRKQYARWASHSDKGGAA